MNNENYMSWEDVLMAIAMGLILITAYVVVGNIELM